MPKIYAIGDSLTANGTYLAVLSGLLGPNFQIVNLGVGGATTSDIIGQLLQIVHDGTNNYLIVIGGINDIAEDVPVDTIESNLQFIYTTARQSRFVIAGTTIFPFKGAASWSVPKQASLNTVNDWILSTANSVDFKLSGYTLLQDPNVPDTLLPAYDSGDHLHLSNDGYGVVANEFYNSGVFYHDFYMPSEATTIISDACSDGLACLDHRDLLVAWAQAANATGTANSLLQDACANGVACLNKHQLLIVIAQAYNT